MISRLKLALKNTKHRKAGVIWAVLLLYILLIASFIASSALHAGLGFAPLFIAISFLPPTLLWILIREGKEYLPALRLRLPRPAHALPLVAALLVLASGSVILNLAFAGSDYVNMSLYGAFYASTDGFWDSLLSIAALALLPAIFEELLFRGVLCAELETNGAFCSVVGSAILFSMLDLGFAALPSRLFAGIVFAVVLYATRSLLCSMILHLAYNLFAIFAQPRLIAIRDVSAHTDTFVFILLLVFTLSLIALLSLLARIYRSYSEKNLPSEHARPIPASKLPYACAEMLLSPQAIACYVIFIAFTIISALV